MSEMSAVPLLLTFGRGERRRFTWSAALAAVSALFQLAPLVLAFLVVDELLNPPVDVGRLWLYGVLAVVAILVRSLLYMRALQISHIAAYQVLYDVRIEMSEALARLPLGWFERHRPGALKKTMGEDVEELEHFLAHGIPDFALAAAAVVSSTVVLVVADWRLALATLVSIPLALLGIRIGERQTHERMGEYHRSGQRMNAGLVEHLQGMGEVRLFNRSGERARRTEQEILDHAGFISSWARDYLWAGTFYVVAITANVVFILPVGLALYVAGSVSLSVLVLFLLLGLGYAVPLVHLWTQFSRLQGIAAGGQEIRDLLNEPPQHAPDRPAVLDGHSVELRDVRFSYGGGDALTGVSFAAGEGEVTALVGPSGAGKTTIARLVARFFDVDSGAVLVGGVDVREMPVAQLMDEIAFVFQDTFLFHDTIAANIALARPDADRDEIERVARAARCHEFVTALPEGYDTVVGERGASLSGGQRQRLAIACALLKDAPIVVLDEATAHADPENEAAIQEAIARLTAGRTLLVIAHRLSTIAGADQILVIDAGRVAERGRHDDLLARDGLYARMWSDHVATLGWSLGASPVGVVAT